MVIASKLRNANRAGADYPSSDARRIITILQDYDFWRVPECVRHRDEIPVGGDDGEAVPLGVIPNLAIGGATAQANLSDVNRTREKILNKLHQPAGEVLVKKELHSV
jgi:hypothetical protein